MNPTATIDTTRFNGMLDQLHDALIGAGRPGDAATVVEDESRLFLKQVIRLTPPKNKKQGQDAVRKDLLKIFTPVSEELLNNEGSKHGVSNIDAWLTTADGEDKHIKWDRIDPTGAGMEEFHRANQNARGRTRKLKANRDKSVWYSPYIVSFEDFEAYLRKVQDKVGRRRAGWGVSYTALHGRVAAWIAKHIGGAKGRCFNQVANPGHPSVTMTNFSPGIQEDERVVMSAMRIRMSAMKKRMKLIISGYAKDVAQGIKISRKERASNIEVAE